MVPPGERREPSVCQPPSLSGHAQLHTWPITVLAHKGQEGGQAGLQGSGGKRKCHSSFCPASRYSSGMSVALITIPGSTRTQHRRRWEERVPLLKQAHKARFTALSTKARAHLPARSSPSGARHHSLQGTREQPPQSHCSALHRNKSTAAPTRSPELHGHSHTASGSACSPHGSQHSYAETEQEMKLPSGSHCSLCRQNKGCQTETPVRASPHTLHQKPPGWVSPHVMHQKHMESLISLSVSPDQKGNLVPLQGPTGAVRGHQT